MLPRRHVVALLAVLAALPLTAVADPLKPGDPRIPVTKPQAHSFINQNQWFMALPILDVLIAKNPTDADLYIDRAKARAGLLRFDEALADREQVVKLQPKSAVAYDERGCVHLRVPNHFNEALADFKTALELDPKLAIVYAHRGKIYEAQGKLDQAIAEYTAGIKLDPKCVLPRRHRMQLELKQKQFDAALRDADELIAQVPNSPDGYNLKGNYYLEKDDKARALELYSEAIKRDANDPSGYLNRAAVKSKLGRTWDAVADAITAADRAGDDFQFLFTEAQYRIAMGDYENTIKTLNRAHKILPNYVPTLFVRGQWHAQHAAVENALDDFNEIIRLDPKHAQAYMWRGGLYLWKKEDAKAQADFATSLRLDPSLKGTQEYLISTTRELIASGRRMLPKSNPDD